MNLLKPIPQVRVIPLHEVRFHETSDPIRVEKLKNKLMRSGVLKHPPIATSHNGCFVVLDGTTRTQALSSLKITHMVVQLVTYEEPEVLLDSWHHVIFDFDLDQLLVQLDEISDLERIPCKPDEVQRMLTTRQCAFGLMVSDGQCFAYKSTALLEEQIKQLNHVVSIYRGMTRVFRTISSNFQELRQQHPDLSAVILFPRFQPEDVTHCAMNHVKFPMGLTRHMIYGRVLGLNIPIQFLSEDQSLNEKNTWLENEVMERVRSNMIRCYEECTLVFEEGLQSTSLRY